MANFNERLTLMKKDAQMLNLVKNRIATLIAESTEGNDSPALYVGSYGKYAGEQGIEGSWLKLEDYADAEDFINACYELHSDEEDPEIMFQDCMGIPDFLYQESLSHDNIEDIYSWLALDEDERERMEAYEEVIGGANGRSIEERAAEAENAYFTTLDKNNAGFDLYKSLAEQMVDEGIIDFDNVEFLQRYFDYEALGRDLSFEYSIADNGMVFSKN